MTVTTDETIVELARMVVERERWLDGLRADRLKLEAMRDAACDVWNEWQTVRALISGTELRQTCDSLHNAIVRLNDSR